MQIIKSKLTDDELKKLRRRLLILRVISVFTVVPVIILIIYFIASTLKHLSVGTVTMTDLFSTLISLTLGYMIVKYAYPFYKRAITDSGANEKFIIRTKILRVESEFISDMGYRYTIFTDIPSQIISTQTVLIGTIISFGNLEAGMDIEIHCMDERAKRILSIKKV